MTDSVAGEHTDHLAATAAKGIEKWATTEKKIRDFKKKMQEAKSPRYEYSPFLFSLKHFEIKDAISAIEQKITGHPNADIMADIQKKINGQFTLFISEAATHNQKIIEAYGSLGADAEKQKAIYTQKLKSIQEQEQHLQQLIRQFQEHQNKLSAAKLD